MSVEALAIAAIVKEGPGGLRTCYQQNISAEDFVTYEEEFRWIEDRATHRQPINVRIFRRKFPDFEFLQADERLHDLLVDLKQETAFTQMSAAIESLAVDLEVDNAIQKAESFRDILGQITRQYAPASDHALIGDWQSALDNQRRLRKLRNAGIEPGVPTGIKHIDFHWDGLIGGRMIVVLGRPGEGKSFLTAKFASHAVFSRLRVLQFSPEMNRHEHECRLHTLLSAYPEVKRALGLENAFRNRALMRGSGFNLKTYKKFLEYLAEECGEMILMTGVHRKEKMTPGFIESKIADLGPDIVIIDPIYKLKPTRGRKTRIEELSDISDEIEDLAETYNVPIVVTNQAHRQMSGRDDAPHKDTSFNSDVPIQEADHVIGVKNMAHEKRMILRCTKSRFGEDFRVELRFHPNIGIMRETEEPKGSYLNGHDDEVEDDELRELIHGTEKPKKRGKEKAK